MTTLSKPRSRIAHKRTVVKQRNTHVQNRVVGDLGETVVQEEDFIVEPVVQEEDGDYVASSESEDEDNEDEDEEEEEECEEEEDWNSEEETDEEGTYSEYSDDE